MSCSRNLITGLATGALAPLLLASCGNKEPGTSKDKDNRSHKSGMGMGIEMRAVDPSGVTIELAGKSIEIPPREPFHIAQREVTQAVFEELMGHNPSLIKARHLPVDRVTHTEASAFCDALTARDRAAGFLSEGQRYRLPTSGEWLKAALPGGLAPKVDTLDAIAWHYENSAGSLHPVATKRANAYGLHDMFGNAAEWTAPDGLSALMGARWSEAKHVGIILLKVSRWPDAAKALSDAGINPEPPLMEVLPLEEQAQLIRSATVLAPMAERFHLVQRWKVAGVGEAVSMLAERTRVSVVEGTNLIRLGYYADDSSDALNLAEGIADSYQRLLFEWEEGRAARSLSIFDAHIHVCRDKVEASRLRMVEVLKKYDLADLASGKPSRLRSTKPGQTDEAAERMWIAIRVLKSLEGTDLVETVADLGLGSAEFENRYREYHSSLAKLNTLRESGMGLRHPKVLALTKFVRLTGDYLAEHASDTKLGLRSATVVPLPPQSSEKTGVHRGLESLEYVEAHEKYAINRARLKELESHLDKYQVDLRSLPPAVRIVEREAVAAEHAPPDLFELKSGAENSPHIAIGGSVYNSQANLMGAIGGREGDGRTDGVGFRFVLVGGFSGEAPSASR